MSTPPPLPSSAATPEWTNTEVQAHLRQPVLDQGRPVRGTEGLSIGEVEDDILCGGKFLIFPWGFSVVIMSFRRNSPLYFVRSTSSVGALAWLWTLPSLLVGWWGIPWGVIFTLMNLYRNCMGGRDATSEVLASLVGPTRAAGIVAKAPARKADIALWLLRIFILAIPAALVTLITVAVNDR